LTIASQVPPPEVHVPPALAIELARRHGISTTEVRRIEHAGIINTVVSLDDRFVLRVPRDHPAHLQQARAEATAIPLAVAAGVRTPRLVAYDDTCAELPVPYLITEFVAGDAVEPAWSDPRTLTKVWRDLGRDLARLHTLVAPEAWPRGDVTRVDVVHECHEMLDARVAEGWISALEADWLRRWIDDLGSGLDEWARSATHGDVQMSNVLVHPDGSYAALLDWGCAAAKDPVVDFMPLPLALVPGMLSGHREVARLPDDANAERRILLIRLRTWLRVLPRGGAPGMTWGERRGAWIADLLHFFVEPPNGTWRELGPPI
jgi:hygromycin-B 7''-O-kinase